MNAIKFETWEPGNCTRYDLAMIDEQDGYFLLLLKIGAKIEGMRMYKGDTQYPAYVHEKTGWRIADIAAIFAWLGTKGVKCVMPDNFNDKGLWESFRAMSNES